MVIIDGQKNPASISREKLMELLKDEQETRDVINAEFPEAFTLSFDEENTDFGCSFYSYETEDKELMVHLSGEEGKEPLNIGYDISLDGGEFGFGMM